MKPILAIFALISVIMAIPISQEVHTFSVPLSLTLRVKLIPLNERSVNIERADDSVDPTFTGSSYSGSYSVPTYA